ncbi:MAG: class I SAM-dependent rRNA methyltransferase [Clostridiales bacterium]|nr:class I SAM-dependent rRNA methyltransferase [Clostridiales bacterium]
MKQQRSFPVAVVTPKAEAAVKRGHPWVYDTEITKFGENTIKDGLFPEEDPVANGALVDVLSSKERYLGTGFLSKNSKIRIRILSDNANETFGETFWQRRVKYALDMRRTVMQEDYSCCRLIFGEADGIPGLTVDRYEDILSTEVLSYGTEQVKDMIYRALVDELRKDGVSIRGIFERNEAVLREKEGLPLVKGWYKGDYLPGSLDGAFPSPRVGICENGIRYTVDVENGQKTGFFLDQKYNRLAVSKLAKGMKVLDCFTHTGSFAMNAARGGASHVTAVDVSQFAVDTASENARINGLSDRMDFICADVFELLPKLEKEHADYNFIILDPPAFTKSRKTTENAKRGYKEINYRAMKMLPRGGYLATCSCSHFMPNELFRKMLLEAAADAGVTLRLIEERRAAPDHPVAMAIPETDYLKFYLLQIV